MQQPPKARRLIEKLSSLEPKPLTKPASSRVSKSLQTQLRLEREARWEKHRAERQKRARSQQPASTLAYAALSSSSHDVAAEDRDRQPSVVSTKELETLFLLGCPSNQDDFFYKVQMEEAAQRGLSFVEALHFVSQRRQYAMLVSKLRAFRSRKRSLDQLP